MGPWNRLLQGPSPSWIDPAPYFSVPLPRSTEVAHDINEKPRHVSLNCPTDHFTMFTRDFTSDFCLQATFSTLSKILWDWLHFQEVCSEIISMANESMRKARQTMPPNSVISFDGSWEHRRKAMRYPFSVICNKTGQVITSIVVSNKVARNEPTFCTTPSLMESQGLKALLPRLMTLKNVIGYVHHNDAKSRKLITEAGWDVVEFLDVGHCVKSFERKINNFNRKNDKILSEIEDCLKEWLKVLIRHRETIEEKEDLCLNARNHFCGDHSRCLPHGRRGKWSEAENAKSRDLLEKVLRSTLFIIQACNSDYTTQRNESLHRLKLKYASKDVKWGFTWDASLASRG